jgi:hypothetical protein
MTARADQEVGHISEVKPVCLVCDVPHAPRTVPNHLVGLTIVRNLERRAAPIVLEPRVPRHWADPSGLSN